MNNSIMNYEQKHQEDLEAAKGWIAIAKENNNRIAIQILENLFPELKKSEDEKIRKELKSYFDSEISDYGNVEWRSGIYYGDVVAWLEKKQAKSESIAAPRWMIDFLNEYRKNIGCALDYDERKEVDDKILAIITWMESLKPQQKQECGEDERQGDRKHADKIEPKFKVGDWVVQENIGVYKIIEVCLSWYEVIDNEDNHYSISFDNEHMCHLWTIQDAKDGDILATGNNSICIFDGTVEEGIYPFAYCGLTRCYGFGVYDRKLPFTHDNNVHPATKEQRDLLFQKMHEAGYEWDVENKELKNIEQTSTEDTCKLSDCDKVDMTEYNNGYECGKQRVLKYPEDYGLCKKPTWSEKDEIMFSGLKSIVEDWYNTMSGEEKEYYGDCGYIDWLKSIKERIKGE